PAKAAVVASALTGSISGSAVANVMSTGIFTIPLMKRVGYSSDFAGGTEAAASTGGQIMPPVMGAGAFIMADFLQVPYQHVVLGALIPSLLYFAGIFAAVDLQARRSNIKRLTREEIGSISEAFRERWHMLLPLVWLIVQIVRGYDVISAVVEASALTVIFGTLRATTRMPAVTLVEALIRAAERTVVVALPCALASIVVMVISLTGLGTKLSAMIVDVSAGNLWLAVAFGGVGCLILGCGMPTTSAYIMAAILVAPALAKLGVDPMVGHLYIFYVAVLANVTPPVALAAYAAASVAGSSANKTSWRAFSLAMPGLAVAWAMVLQPSIVKWGSPGELSFAVLQAFMANMAISIAMVGWLGRPLNLGLRALAMVIALLMLTPTLNTTIVAFIAFAGLAAFGFSPMARREQTA
ncbi:MAG: TRAP transporter fused permease subunit, partial [Hyphomicrobiales bacterium]|nr:TRAP transporter fused permease subunit [Hyphomicrobiales bacterium]